MKKWIAFFTAAAMILPVTAFGAGADPDVSGAQGGSVESVLESIQDDFSATIDQLKEDLDAVYEVTGETYSEYLDSGGSLSDWYEDCVKDAERLFDRTWSSSLEYYQYVAADAAKDPGSAEDALDEYWDRILDGAANDFYDEIIVDALDEIYDQYANGVLEEGYESVESSEWWDTYSIFYDAWWEAYTDLDDMWWYFCTEQNDLWCDVRDAFVQDGNYDLNAVLTPAEEAILTADSSSEFAEMLACEDSVSQIYADFYDEHQGDVVEFDGTVILVEPDGRHRSDGAVVYDDGYYDILICPGDRDEDTAGGPQFLFDGTTAELLGFGGLSDEADDAAGGDLPEFLAEGNPVHVTAKLYKYDDGEGICYLKPVSVAERES